MARRFFVLLVSLALLAVACTDDDPAIEPAGSPSSSTSTSSSSSTTQDATSTIDEGTSSTAPGGSGTPLEGPVGSGEMDYRLVVERSEFCYRISVTGMGMPTEAHVHRSDGEVVLALQPPEADDSVDTCAATDALLIEEIDARPHDFYLEVHSPQGALRATLG